MSPQHFPKLFLELGQDYAFSQLFPFYYSFEKMPAIYLVLFSEINFI